MKAYGYSSKVPINEGLLPMNEISFWRHEVFRLCHLVWVAFFIREEKYLNLISDLRKTQEGENHETFDSNRAKILSSQNDRQRPLRWALRGLRSCFGPYRG
jgi:hypothetical protein